MPQPASHDARRDLWLFSLSVATAAATLLSIAAAQILLSVTVLFWLVARPRPVRWPGYILPLAAFVATTAAAIAFSPEVGASLSAADKFVLFAMGPLAATTITSERRYGILIRALAVTALLGSAIAIVQFGYLYSGYLETGALRNDPANLARITGPMGHWMTFGGQQMLVWSAVLAAGWLLGSRWHLGVLSVLGVTLLLTLTRSVWIGAFAAGLVVIPYAGSRVLLRLAVPVGVVAVLISALLVQRISIGFDPGKFAPDRARIEMIDTGLRMVRAHPLFGVGPGRIETEFPNFYRGDQLDTFDYYGHLHNDFLQIAAERGLLSLIALVWFFGRIGLDLVRMSRSRLPDLRWASVSGLCVLTAFLVGGMFEYNFGDSEVFMIFIFLVSIPYGLEATHASEVA